MVARPDAWIPAGVDREDRQPDHAQQQVQDGAGQPAPEPERGAHEEDAERLERERHVRVGGHVQVADGELRDVERDVRAGHDQGGAHRNHQQVALPDGGAFAQPDRDQEVPEGEPPFERRDAT